MCVTPANYNCTHIRVCNICVLIRDNINKFINCSKNAIYYESDVLFLFKTKILFYLILWRSFIFKFYNLIVYFKEFGIQFIEK